MAAKLNYRLVKIDRNGSKHYEGEMWCPRCGGQGFWEGWRATGMTCWKCGGTGKVFGKWIERTPEYEAILEERRKARAAARAAKEEAERMAQDEEYRKQRELAERLEREERERQERLEAARKAVSQWVGEVGERIEIKGTFEHTAWYKTRDPFGQEVTRYVHTFKDNQGNKFVWKTGCGVNLEYGNPVELRGTVKDHSEYDGERQTVLLRVKYQLHQ